MTRVRAAISAFMMIGCGVLIAGACGKEKESLVIVSLTLPQAEPTVQSLTVRVADVPKSFTLAGGLPAAYSAGVYVPARVTGTGIAVVASASGSGKCLAGSTTADIVSVGVTVRVTIALAPAATCGGSGGTGGTDGGATGAGGGGAGGSNTGTGGSSGGTGGGTGTGGADGGTDGPPQVVPPSLSRCVEINQFANNTTCATDWGITLVAFSPDGRYLASGDQSGQTKIWNMNGGTATAEGHLLSAGTGGNMQPVFSPDGTLLAAGTTNGGLALWTAGGTWAKRGDFVATPALSDVRGVAFSPDGSQVMAIDYDLNTFRVFSVATLAQVGNPRTFGARPTAMACAPRAVQGVVWVAVGLTDGRMAVFDLAQPMQAPQIVAVAANLTGGWSVDAVAWSPAGAILAAAASDSNAGIWNVAPTGVTLRPPAITFGTDEAFGGLAFSADGRFLLAGTGYFTPGLGIWEIATGQNRGRYVPRFGPLGVTFSPAGNVVVAGQSSCGMISVCAD